MRKDYQDAFTSEKARFSVVDVSLINWEFLEESIISAILSPWFTAEGTHIPYKLQINAR